jgi:hypothetical protein
LQHLHEQILHLAFSVVADIMAEEASVSVENSRVAGCGARSFGQGRPLDKIVEENSWSNK